MENRPCVLVLAFSDLTCDTRIRRQIIALSSEYRLIVVGNNNPKITNVQFIPSGFHKKTIAERVCMYSGYLLGWFDAAYWHPKWMQNLRKCLSAEAYDVIIANDLDTLPLACSLKNHYGVFLDAHEYAPREFDHSLVWRLLFGRLHQYQCKTYLPQTNTRTTVAPGIAKEYEVQFGQPFTLLTNATAYQTFFPKPCGEAAIHMVHHGAALPSRGLEDMIEVMRHTDERFYLHFYLVGNPAYVARLQKQAKLLPHICFHLPVCADTITEILHQYDIGLYIMKGTNFNDTHSLPNKFFEFVQSRLAIAIGPSVEMQPYVMQYNLGIVCNSFFPIDMAKRLNALHVNDINLFKENSHQAALVLSADENARLLRSLVQDMLPTP